MPGSVTSRTFFAPIPRASSPTRSEHFKPKTSRVRGWWSNEGNESSSGGAVWRVIMQSSDESLTGIVQTQREQSSIAMCLSHHSNTPLLHHPISYLLPTHVHREHLPGLVRGFN